MLCRGALLGGRPPPPHSDLQRATAPATAPSCPALQKAGRRRACCGGSPCSCDTLLQGPPTASRHVTLPPPPTPHPLLPVYAACVRHCHPCSTAHQRQPWGGEAAPQPPMCQQQEQQEQAQHQRRPLRRPARLQRRRRPPAPSGSGRKPQPSPQQQQQQPQQPRQSSRQWRRRRRRRPLAPSGSGRLPHPPAPPPQQQQPPQKPRQGSKECVWRRRQQ